MPLPLLAALAPTLVGGALGAISSRNAPRQQTTSQGGTSTSTTTLPAPLMGQAMFGLDRSRDLFNRQFQNGVPIAELPQFVNQAGDFASNVLSGDAGRNRFASGQDTNQFLQNAFNRAANLSQSRLASEFSRAGRFGAPAQQTLRADELGSISSGLLMPLLESERNRQFAAEEANLGRQFGAVPLGLGISQMQQGHRQAQLDAPETALNRQIARTSGLAPFFPGTTTTNQTGSVTQPLYNSPMSGFLGGAMLGSQFNLPGLLGKPSNPADGMMGQLGGRAPNVGFNPIPGMGGLGMFGAFG